MNLKIKKILCENFDIDADIIEKVCGMDKEAAGREERTVRIVRTLF